MSKLTSQQRKLMYLVLIVVLLVPIYLIGAPSTGEADSGGELARLKREYDLGEEQFGNVDPSSATINLVLLGLRGVAANILWVQHDEQKNQKDWAGMRATTESIIMLQPHYMHVWRYHGWDLAYNVSAEWDRRNLSRSASPPMHSSPWMSSQMRYFVSPPLASTSRFQNGAAEPPPVVLDGGTVSGVPGGSHSD